MSELIYQGQVINQRADGYVNATQMCTANGKKVNDWLRLKSTDAYIEGISTVTGIPATHLVVFEAPNATANFGGCTWVHPLLAIALAQWISPQFHVWCNINIKTLIETGEVKLESSQPKLHPADDIKKWNDVAIEVANNPNPMIRSILEQRIAEELTSQAYLFPELNADPKEGILTVRARKLGYSEKQIGSGIALGKYIIAQGFKPKGRVAHGRYQVNWYEINKELDKAIHEYFKR